MSNSWVSETGTFGQSIYWDSCLKRKVNDQSRKEQDKSKQLCGYSWKETSVRLCMELWSTNYPTELILHGRKEGLIIFFFFKFHFKQWLSFGSPWGHRHTFFSKVTPVWSMLQQSQCCRQGVAVCSQYNN